MVTGGRSSYTGVNARVARCPSCGYDLSGRRTSICPECGEQFEWHETDPKRWTPIVGLGMATKSLFMRALVGLVIAPWFVYASVYLTVLIGGRRRQYSIAILLGLLFGYLFGRGFSERAGFSSIVLYFMLAITTATVGLAASFGVHELFAGLVANAGEQRFWFAAGAFSATAIVGALMALWHESQ